MTDKDTKAMFPVRLEKELLEKGKALATRRGMSLAALVRRLLIQEIEKEGK